MNRRDFLKRGAIGAATAAVVIPVAKAVTQESFPMTKDEMVAIVEAAKVSGEFGIRQEGTFIMEGLCQTVSPISLFWYYHKGDKIAVLHQRFADNHECFYVEPYKQEQPVYTRPHASQWARNTKRIVSD